MGELTIDLEIVKIKIGDEIYPEQLRKIKNPPKQYLKGNIELLKQNCIAIIGSRSCTKNGENLAKKFASELSGQGLTIVSGMAKGIDAIVHRKTIDENGKTIAVLGSGLNYIFPKENEGLYYDILKSGGLIISEYSPNVEPNSKMFLERNRIVSGISIGILVIEAMDRKGIHTQTDLAQAMNITKNQLSVLLSDSYNPIKSSVEKLCTTLDILPEDIMSSSPHHDKAKPSITPGEVTAIELFAGAGGLALGLEQAGIHTLEYVEIDKFSCETLKKNRPNWNVVCDDIHNVDFTEYKGKVDIVTGGFPCQAFSYAGKKLGFEDTRGTLFHEFARCVNEVQPSIFLAENVRGLISHAFFVVLDILFSIKYLTPPILVLDKKESEL